MRTLVVLSVGLFGAMSQAQEVDTSRTVLSIELHYGVMVPLGRFGGYPMANGVQHDRTAMLGAGATSGPVVSAAVNYSINSRFGIVVSGATTKHDRLNDNYADHPSQCFPCRDGYISPRPNTQELQVGRWRSTSGWIGPSYIIVPGQPSITVRAGVGAQHWRSDQVSYHESGDRLVNDGVSPIQVLPYEFSLVQPVTFGTALVYDVGLVLRHRLVGRLSFSGSAVFAGGEVLFTGDQLMRYDGATQSQIEVHTRIERPFKERSSMTRISFQAGLQFDVMRRRT